jgi:beta-phosphoglucomutase-like phosphatase (HAD superfamily)
MNPRTLWTPILAAMLAAIGWCCGAAYGSAAADTFSFSSAAAKAQDKEEAANQAQAVRQLVSVPCQQRLKNRRILLLIAERTGDAWLASQDRYGPLLRVIESRLKALGLKTYTQQQIKADVAQAEVDAYFRNDPDAALAASKRLGANYGLRGSITSQAGINPVVQVNEVAVKIDLTLSGVDGRVLSDVSSHSDSYSGGDTLGTALALVREQADPLVAQLYNDYCRDGSSR